jgi:hypothetical protein
MPPSSRTLAVLLALFVVAGCRPPPAPESTAPAAVPSPPASAVEGRVAAHWFGRQWPKNFLSGFRREHVDEDFRRLADDGFDTVVLLVSWGDFQPVPTPCCRYDERAFERLRFLLDRAQANGLKVMLRLGYAWSFHPEAGDSGERQQLLMNDPGHRDAYRQFLTRVSDEIAGHPGVVMAFMSWEDQWLRRLDESVRADYAEYLATLAPPAPATGALPDPMSDAARFHGFWDWLVIEKLYAPARGQFPNLSYEVRVDREPRYETGPDGKPVVAEWLAHDGMFRLPEGHPVTVYWAPFWGALNQGEQLPAEKSLSLLAVMLAEAQAKSGGRRLFIDQFNFVDNTPGHGHNAVLRPHETAAFLHRAVCVMQAGGVAGYGLWTARDYAENPLHNPAFGYGLDAWTLERAAGRPEDALEILASGDFQLRLAPGDRLSQQVPPRHGRLPVAGDALPDRVCVEADVRAPGRLAARAGGATVTLDFEGAGRQNRCADITPAPDAQGLAFSLQLQRGELSLRSVQLFDHVQYGGLYDLDGRPGPLLDPVRRMNHDFRSTPAPARCSTSSQDQPVQP